MLWNLDKRLSNELWTSRDNRKDDKDRAIMLLFRGQINLLYKFCDTCHVIVRIKFDSKPCFQRGNEQIFLNKSGLF